MGRGEVKEQIILCLNFFLSCHKYEFYFYCNLKLQSCKIKLNYGNSSRSHLPGCNSHWNTEQMLPYSQFLRFALVSSPQLEPSHNTFNLLFPDDKWHWNFITYLLAILFFLNVSVQIQIFCLFKKHRLFPSLLLNCNSSLLTSPLLK